MSAAEETNNVHPLPTRTSAAPGGSAEFLPEMGPSARVTWAFENATCLPQIDITNERDAALSLVLAINDQLVPNLYVRDGRPVEVIEVMTKTGKKLQISEIGPDRLRRLLAEYTLCYREKEITRNKETFRVKSAALPGMSTVQAVLKSHEWPGLPVLTGVTRMPIVRPDGSVLTERGYDAATQLYYWPAFQVPHVPEDPSVEVVREARRFLLDYLLRDVCWDSDASRANYVGLLFTPLMRIYIGSLLPFGIISAATPGSGKTMLTDIIGRLYGMHPTTWARTGEEFDKRVTGYLEKSDPVVCFDNVGEGVEIKHDELAMLLTNAEYGGRTLGTNTIPSGVNDKLWLATGNNLVVGGDIPQRSVLVRLDPKREDPEERSGFAIEEDIWKWLGQEENQIRIMHSLLVLARAWVSRGAARDESHRMRNFTTWAQIIGGLVAWLELPDFLANAAELKAGNDEKSMVIRFLAAWHDKYGDTWKSAQQLVDSARIDYAGDQSHDPWGGNFPTKEVSGKNVAYNSVGLGRWLNARRDRIWGGYRLVKSESAVNGTFQWRSEKM